MLRGSCRDIYSIPFSPSFPTHTPFCPSAHMRSGTLSRSVAMTEDEWVKSAMLDDSVAVDLLLGLNHSAKRKPFLPLHWIVRQPRSKPVIPVRPKSVGARDSPPTPLSWRSLTSVSCGGVVDGGPEESTYPPPSKASGKARSKLTQTSEKSTTKRPRKKKTMAELKQVENVLLQERRLLKKELAILCVNLEIQRATNENLKRMKLDLQPQLESERDVALSSDLISPTVQQNSAYNAQLPQSFAPNNVSAEQEQLRGLEISVTLPDLNLPLEMDEVICRI